MGFFEKFASAVIGTVATVSNIQDVVTLSTPCTPTDNDCHSARQEVLLDSLAPEPKEPSVTSEREPRR